MLLGCLDMLATWLCWLLFILVGWIYCLADYNLWLSSLDLMSG
jgi:hypothetical protein